jgi:ABC-2 type transport system ATP-binding protein
MGKIIAMGTPRELIEKSAGQSTIEIICNRAITTNGTLPVWPDAVNTTLTHEGTGMIVISSRPARTLVEIVKWIDAQGLELVDVNLKRPTLEDVFIELTGKKIRE